MTETLIGIDIGTTAVKAILFDQLGHPLDSYTAPYPTHYAPGGVVEQDADIWLHHIRNSLDQFKTNNDLSSLLSIGLTSQVNTHVFVGRDGRPLAPAIVWQDGRSSAQAADLDTRISPSDQQLWWGGPRPLDASHCLSRMRWMQQHHPDIWAETRWVMLPKDYCTLWLTGQTISDVISNFGNLDLTYQPIDTLLSLVPGAAERLLPLAPITDIAGVVRSELPCAGTPVAVGTMDAWAGMFGVGVESDDKAMYLSGTSEILGIISQKKHPTGGVIIFPTYDGLTLHAGPTQAGGASLMWLSELFRLSPGELAAKVAELDFTQPCPLFLPHLQGERAPIWDINARGTFIGIDSSMGIAELTRAIFEGVACSAQWLFETIESSACIQPDTLNCGGGGFRSDVWNQIRANILNKRLQRLSVADSGVLGAAIISAVAIGLEPSLNQAFTRIARFDKIYEPDPTHYNHYHELTEMYRETYKVNRALNHRLVKLYSGT